MSSGDWWRQSNGLPPIPKCDPDDPRTWTYGAPFSWTSFDDTVKWERPSDSTHSALSEYDAQIIDGDTTPSGPDPFGPVANCWITLRGVLCQREEMEGQSMILHPDPDQPYGGFFPRTCFIRLCVDTIEGSLRFVQKWLVLYPVGDEGKEYRRIGLMTIQGDFSLDWTDMMDIKLV